MPSPDVADAPRRRPRRWRADALTAFGVLAVVGALYFGTDLIDALERRFYDHGSTASGRSPGDHITVVAIDDASINAIGRWPWPREVHAELIDRLSALGARTIAHTAFFFEPQTSRGLEPIRALRERIAGPDAALSDLGPQAQASLLRDLAVAEQRLDSDSRLAASVKASGRVVLPSVFELGEPRGRADAPLPAFAQRNAVPDLAGFGVPAQRTQQPLPALGNAAVAVGHLNQWLDPDGAVRQEPLLVRFDGVAVPSMALLAAAHSLNLSAADIRLQPGEGLSLGPGFIPTDDLGRVLPQFYAAAGRPSAFPTVSVQDVLAQRVSPELIRDRIVIIGATAAGVGTLFNTPVGTALSPAEILAHTTASVLNGHFIANPTWGALVVLALLVLILVYLIWWLPRLGAAAGATVTAAGLAMLLGGEFLVLSRAALWLPLVLPATLLLLGHLALTTRRFLVTEARKRQSDQESAETNRQMGLALLGQGQLDMAFDRFRRVPHSKALMDNLGQLALDFERKRQFNKAESVYAHMAALDRTDPSLRTRQTRAQELAKTVMLGSGGASHPGGTLVLDQPGLAQPMLGRYQVEKELGKGAMGVVYQGRDPKIGRVVAIKTLALSTEFEGLELEEARQRFFREAETAGRLQHPNIVTIFDAGEEHDLAYIAMEFLQGHDLQRHTRSGQLLPAATVLRIGQQVALALDHAHRQNVVHRDIKPANVMLDPATGAIKVTDFGIARITDSTRTKTGVVLGTPSFMAPEQLAGQRVDGRADLYALGAMLYQLLTGELPLRGESLSALMYQIANVAPPDIRLLCPAAPDALSQLLRSLLAKQPQDRPASGADVAAALQSIHWTDDDHAFDATQPYRSSAGDRSSPNVPV
ncbi:MAG: CHASE2 domain-containing protein [Hydrogenophaga sp.]|uniref:CHASE2 domain-containing serine/threonine-protein kinase n=1 Tax=Hydrogenophaga sp. TaxID=1904254 RepID=UPI001DBF7AC6|nr:serine/threonine-protein kinase [Hydrogenophaga sp.]MBX3608447.1 CHASE2 domain-containing protein [Hydrogenophaga sp.]